MLPLTTTRIRVLRAPENVDPYENTSWTIVGEEDGVVSRATGLGALVGGDRQSLQAEVHLNPGIEVKYGDRLEDLTSGEAWIVDWVRKRYELGLEYTKIGVSRTEGAAG